MAGEFQLFSHEEIKWVCIEELEQYDFAEADIPIVHNLIGEK